MFGDWWKDVRLVFLALYFPFVFASRIDREAACYIGFSQSTQSPLVQLDYRISVHKFIWLQKETCPVWLRICMVFGALCCCFMHVFYIFFLLLNLTILVTVGKTAEVYSVGSTKISVVNLTQSTILQYYCNEWVQFLYFWVVLSFVCTSCFWWACRSIEFPWLKLFLLSMRMTDGCLPAGQLRGWCHPSAVREGRGAGLMALHGRDSFRWAFTTSGSSWTDAESRKLLSSRN